MKRSIALAFATLSGLYLLAGPIPDPLLFVDEGLALLVFVKSMGYLGYDVTRWLPFLGRRGRNKTEGDGTSKRASRQTVDV